MENLEACKLKIDQVGGEAQREFYESLNSFGFGLCIWNVNATPDVLVRLANLIPDQSTRNDFRRHVHLGEEA